MNAETVFAWALIILGAWFLISVPASLVIAAFMRAGRGKS